MHALNEDHRRDTSRAGLSKNEQKKIATSTKDAHIMSVFSKCKFLHKCEDRYERQLKKCLQQFDLEQETSLVLKALKFSGYVTICFDMDSENLQGLANSEATGWYNYSEGEILIGAKGLITEELMEKELKGVFIHELTHWCMQTVFKNRCLPYFQSDPNREKEQKFEKIVNAVKKENMTKNLHCVVKSVFENYSSTLWHQELIVRVTHLIGQFGLEEATDILLAHDSTKALLDFYKDDVMAELRKFINDGDSEESRKNIVELNNKLGFLPLYQKHYLQFLTNELTEQEERCEHKTTLYSSPHPYLSLMQFAFVQNCREPTDKFYGNNLFCDLEALNEENFRAVKSKFLKLEECKTLCVVCKDIPSIIGNDNKSPIDRLKELLAMNTHKRVILIVEIKMLELTERILGKEPHISYECIPMGKIMLNDLVEEDRERVMGTEVFVRKQKLKLNEILGGEEFVLADGIFIERVIKEEDIIIDEGGIASNYLPPSFIEFREKLDVTKLVELVNECSNNDDEGNSSKFGLIILIVGELGDYPVLQAHVQRDIYINAVGVLNEMLVSSANDIQEENSNNGRRPFTRPILLMKFPDESDVDWADVVATFQQLIYFDACYFVNVAPLCIRVSYMYNPALVFKRRLIEEYSRAHGWKEWRKPMKRRARKLASEKEGYQEMCWLMDRMRELGWKEDGYQEICYLMDRIRELDWKDDGYQEICDLMARIRKEDGYPEMCDLMARIRKLDSEDNGWLGYWRQHREKWWEKIKNQMKSRYCVVISDTAGRGKTQFLNHIYNTVTDSWMIKYSLKYINEFIDDYTLEKDSMSVEALLPFVWDIGKITKNEKTMQIITKNDKFTRDLIFSKMKNESRFPVTLLLDGFDEITSSDQIESAAINKTKILNIIEFLRSKTFLNIVVTTRPECEQEILRKIRKIKVYKFEDLTLQESEAYITNFIHSKFRVMSKSNIERESVTALVEKYFPSTQKNRNSAEDFLKNPLHVSMMSDVLLENVKDGNTIDSREKLYNKFIDRKYNVYLEEKKLIPRGTTEQLFADSKGKWNSVFEMLAVFSLYPHEANIIIEHFYDKNNLFVTDYPSGTLKLNCEIADMYLGYGIISSVSPGRVEFIHQTFAEHFFSHFMKKCTREKTNAEGFITSMLFSKSLQKYSTSIYPILESAVDYTTIPDETMKAHGNAIINVKSITYKDGMEFHILNRHMNIVRHIFLCLKLTDEIHVNVRFHTIISLLAYGDCRYDYALEFLLEECINVCANDFTMLESLLQSEKLKLKLLKFSITRGNEEIMEFLKSRINDIISEATLVSAIGRGELEVAKWLIKRNEGKIREIRCNGRTLVHEALSEKQYDTVRWLVDEGLDVDEGDIDKRTPLHHAIMCGDLDMVKVICGLGADIHKRSNEGYNAIYYAVKYRVKWNLIEWLVDKSASTGSSSSDDCSSDEKLDIIKKIVAKCFNKSSMFERFDFMQHEELTVLLLKYAMESKSEEIMAFLTSLIENIISKATLLSAIERGELEVAKWINGKNGINTHYNYSYYNEGRTLVHVALSKKQYDVVRWLVVEEGLDVDEGDYEGRSPLHHAIMCEDLDMVKFICHLGANIHKESYEGYCGMGYAGNCTSEFRKCLKQWCRVQGYNDCNNVLKNTFGVFKMLMS